MVTHECATCETVSENARRCSGCHRAWYCSTACQERNWPIHIFDCRPNKPINSVYHLARACYRDLVPIDHQTRKDYGFEKAEALLGGESGSMLLGLYQGVFNVLSTPPKEVRRWKEEGKLSSGIKDAFATVKDQISKTIDSVFAPKLYSDVQDGYRFLVQNCWLRTLAFGRRIG